MASLQRVVFWAKKASKNDNERVTLLFRLHSSHVRWLRPVIGQISSLQATQMTQEAAIRDLDNERSRLKDKVLRLEEERESLQSQCQALEDRQNQQLLSLEKVCTRGSVRWNGHGVRGKKKQGAIKRKCVVFFTAGHLTCHLACCSLCRKCFY